MRPFLTKREKKWPRNELNNTDDSMFLRVPHVAFPVAPSKYIVEAENFIMTSIWCEESIDVKKIYV
jgi:hypothetical protein